MNFTEQRRQQFLTEEYYLKTKEYYAESIQLYLESDAFEDDQYNCGESERWGLITFIFSDLLYINYTAGNPIKELPLLFEKVIDGYEKKLKLWLFFINLKGLQL